jgi:acetyltransferase-like isoleucine patch superfamily enzyme
MFSKFILKIKRKENAFYGLVHEIAKASMSLSVPSIKPIHLFLYYVDVFVKRCIKGLLHAIWSVPLFKARCERVGKRLSLPNGIPFVMGSHLRIRLGDNVNIGRSTIGASKIYDEPVLEIGNNSTIGYGTIVSVSKEVVIGDNCLIGPNCIIMDSDDHPINPGKRLKKQTVDKDDVLSVRIGNNVWIGSYCAILKGVKIGDNSIIAAHSVVARDILPNCVYAGFPARPTLRDIDKL